MMLADIVLLEVLPNCEAAISAAAFRALSVLSSDEK